MARIGIIGSDGRMGHALVEAITEAGETLAGGVDQGGDVEALARASDVLVDFSHPAALEANLDAAAAPSISAVPDGASILRRWCISTISISQSGSSRSAASRTK